MVNVAEDFIYHFETGKSQPQVFFEELLKTALRYKYGNSGVELAKVTPQDLTEAIFGISHKDNLSLFGKNISGQRVSELFIASIYLKYLDGIHPEKTIIITIPYKEEAHDVAIYVTGKNGIKNIGQGKFKLTEQSTAYLIQIKEEFDFKASKNGYSELKDGVNLDSLKKKASRYDELVLIFMRDYALYNSSQTQTFLNENRNVGLILMPSTDSKEIELKEGPDKGQKIVIESDKFNFLLNTSEYTIHIKYSVPRILQPITNQSARETSPLEGMTAQESFVHLSEEAKKAIIRIRKEKKEGLRLKPSAKLIDESELLNVKQRKAILDKVAELVDENLTGRSDMCIQFAELLQRALQHLNFQSKFVYGSATYFVEGKVKFQWKHAWVRIGKEVVDGNVDSIFENPAVPPEIKLRPYWGKISETPNDRKLREDKSYNLEQDVDVNDVWWPELKEWLNANIK